MSTITYMELDLNNPAKGLVVTSSQRDESKKQLPVYTDEIFLFLDTIEKIHSLKNSRFNTEMAYHLIDEAVTLYNANKTTVNGNTYSKNLLKKVSAMSIPAGIPTPYTLYVQEIKESVKEGWSLKLLLTAILTAFINWLGSLTINLVCGLVILGLIDALLALIPGNIKPGTEKDHKLQSKVWNLITNIVAIVAVVKAQEILRSYANDESLFSLMGNTFHYVIVGWIFSIYVYRVVKYVARANRVSIPEPILTMFKRNKNSE